MRRSVSRWLCLATVFAGFLASSSLLQAQTPPGRPPVARDCLLRSMARHDLSFWCGAKESCSATFTRSGFCPCLVRSRLSFSATESKGRGSPASARAFADITSLLENPFAFGASAVSDGAGSPGPNGRHRTSDSLSCTTQREKPASSTN